MANEDMCVLHQEKIHNIEKRQIRMEGDVSHIKERIDNGMSKTITGLDGKFDTLTLKISDTIMPVIEDSKFWIGKLKLAFFWIAVIAVGGGLAKVFIDWVH